MCEQKGGIVKSDTNPNAHDTEERYQEPKKWIVRSKKKIVVCEISGRLDRIAVAPIEEIGNINARCVRVRHAEES